MLMLFFIFLLSFYFPLEKQGLNNEPLSFNIQPYLFENQIYLYSNENFSKAEEIYSRYTISFSILDPIKINQTLEDNYTKLIFNQNCTIIEELFNLTNYQDEKTIKLILIEYNGSIGGMAHICGKGNLAIITLNNSILYSLHLINLYFLP